MLLLHTVCGRIQSCTAPRPSRRRDLDRSIGRGEIATEMSRNRGERRSAGFLPSSRRAPGARGIGFRDGVRRRSVKRLDSGCGERSSDRDLNPTERSAGSKALWR